MILVIKHKRRKIKIPLKKEVVDKIEKISKKFSLKPEKIIDIALKENFEIVESPNFQDIENLKLQLKKIQSEMFRIEGKYSALKYDTHTFIKENKGMAITLSGLMTENRSLRRRLKLPSQNLKEIEEIVDKYLFFF